MKRTPLPLLGLALPALLHASLSTQPFSPASLPEGDTLFTQLSAEQTGLSARNNYSDPEMWGERYHEFQGGAVGTGLAAGDVNGDGFTDLYVVNKFGPNSLYLQTAPLIFEDHAATAGVASEPEVWNTGSTLADIDNDGDLDLYLCRFGAPNQLFLNDGQGRFTEAAKAAGIDLASGSVVGAFEDYDRDGDLDLFLLTNLLDSTLQPDGEPDYLYRNNGDGTFTDVTASAGIASDRGKGHSATWWDADSDDWPDLYISNDFEAPDHLYKNNGDGTFTDITEVALPHTAWYSMGADFGDINNDGLLDFLSADMANTTHFKSKVTMGDMGGWVDYFDTLTTPQYMKNAVFLNSGTHRFREVAKMTGLSSTDWTWSTRFEDFDNDGWLDLHVTNGMVRSFTDSDMVNKTKTLKSKRQIIALVKNSPVLAEQNLAFRNDGADTLHFTKTTKEWGLQHEGVSFGSVAADFDNDGDLDLVYANYESELSFYRNDSQARSVTVELVGTRSNRFGIGAKVFAQTSQGTQVRMLAVARGVLSSSQPIAHFGMGDDAAVSNLTIRWPSGETQSFTNIEAGQKLRIIEPDTGASPLAAKPILQEVRGLFAESSSEIGIDFERTETTFNDMNRQPLLPHRMNTLGGGIAVGDVDGDGDSDLYFAGASGYLGALFLNDGSGQYQQDTRKQPWQSKQQQEEMSPLFADFNADGLLDLYISSGSVEVELGAPSLADTLYLNSGDGLFTEANPASYPRPSTSKSVVTAADFDQDGDLDLFVGARVVPGEYPRSSSSALLENDNGVFRDVSESLAPGLADSGMVTAALWTDADSDGVIDLLIVRELDSPRLFLNRNGKLEDKTPSEMTSNLKGWWNSITAADFDNDGDLDYALGNIGLNTKYKASIAHPFKIYFNDFEGTGTCNVVEAKYEGDNLLPVRGRSCSSRAMPSLAVKFPTYHDFGAASLASVYSSEKLESALIKEATELASGILVNDGDGNFTFQQLPRLAQMSPVFGMATADFDGDGNIDLALAQNFDGPQVETGRYDGGLGLVLLGDGRGRFTALEPQESGFFIEGEARGLVLADLDSDLRPDLLVTRTNRPSLAFLNKREGEARPLTVSLQSKDRGNRNSVGARVLITYSDDSKQAYEIASSSGYLSQSEAKVFLTQSEIKQAQRIEVTWPDGSASSHAVPSEVTQLILSQVASLAQN